MDKTIVTIGSIILILILIGIGALLFLNNGNDTAENDMPDVNTNGTPSQEAAEQFTTEAHAKVVSEIGQPIEGFEPSMFLQVYPGLEERDFDGVDALIGGYVYEDGEVVYDLGGEQELHSAARAISPEGMHTLLTNIVERLNINIEGDGTLEAVFAALEMGESGTGSMTEEVTLTGDVVCLPHKDTSGPQTLECAFGLQTDAGVHYGLSGLSAVAPATGIDTNMRIEVQGVSTTPAANNIYDVAAVIEVSSLQEVQ